METQIATIKLFKILLVKNKKKKNPSKDLMNATLNRGFIFSPEVVGNYTESELLELTEEIGLTPEQLNSSFHKSWNKVKDADIEQLIVEQITHYFTTYGFEAMGLEADCYIPKEQLDIPQINNLRLTVIRGLTKEEIKKKLLNLLGGVALGEDTIKDVLQVVSLVGLTDIEQIKNKEVKCAMYGKLRILPENPIEFLRYLVYVCTKRTLLIKSPDIIKELKENIKPVTLSLLMAYKNKYGFEKLAQIFYRFKPIWIAFREHKPNRMFINKIRKLAIEHHIPIKEDYLNSITSKLKNDILINIEELNEELSKVNVFRKIRLAYALQYRCHKGANSEIKPIMYRVRNGKAYTTKIKIKSTWRDRTEQVLEIVLDSIVQDISKNVKKKKIYIPKNIHYTLPSSEKQFTGNFPSGSYISTPKNMIFGIYWENQGKMIDLDLSLIGTEKYGWDGDYRDKDRNILFSGDMTDAKGGATELFYVKNQKDNKFILLVNYYNYSETEVPFKIIVAKEKLTKLKKNYMVNPKKILTTIESKITKKQKVLGLLTTTKSECRFYFTEAYLGNSISSSDSEYVEDSKQYLFDFYQNAISLRDILEKAGARLTKINPDVDLSPEKLEKDTILNLIGGNNNGKRKT